MVMIIMKKCIKGFEQYVLDSIKGTVYNTKTKKYVGSINQSGYITVTLHNGGNQQVCRVNRLIAEYFIPNPELKPEVHHIDEDKTNNSAKNLMWVSHQENMQANNLLNNMSKPIKVSKNDFEKVYPSIHEAERQLGICQGGLSRVINGNAKTAGGYKATFIATKNRSMAATIKRLGN